MFWSFDLISVPVIVWLLKYFLLVLCSFWILLDTFEYDGYVLHSTYKKPNKIINWLKFAGIALVQTWQHALHHIQNGSQLCGRSQNGVKIITK
jgi:hypothetical protein